MSQVARPTRRSLLALTGLGAGASLLAACGAGGDGPAGSDGPTVVTTCYAFDFLTSRITGDQVDLVSLASPGVDAHGLELSVQQVMQIQEADLVLQIAGFQTAVDDAIASEDLENVLEISTIVELLPTGGVAEPATESSDGGGDEHADDDHAGHDHAEEGHEGHDHGPTDPHFWQDPLRVADVGDAIAARLGEIVPDRAAEFTANAEAVRADLEELDAELAEKFGGIDGSRTFITSHAAYAYLADRYELEQVGIAGVDPETEPSPRRLLELEQVVADEGVTTIFFETTASPKVAQTLADNVGVSSEELDNLETQLDESADYLQVMRDNADKLVASWA